MSKSKLSTILSTVMLGLALTAGIPAYANTDNLPADQQGGPNEFPDGYEPDQSQESDDEAGPSSSVDNPILDPQKSNENNSEIIAKADVPDGFEPDTYLQIQNQDTRDVYQISILNENDYRGDAWVPAGDYTILFAGVPEDTTNKYPFELPNPSYFTAEEDGSQTITVRLENYDEIYDMLHSQNDEETDETPSEDETTSDQTEELPSDAAIVPDIYPWRVVNKTGGEGGTETIEVSYDPNTQVQDVYNCVVKISHSGGLGTGKFRMSLDGGKNWSNENDLTADYSIRILEDKKPFDTGIHLHFEDTDYTIGTTYSLSTLKEWKVTHSGSGTGVFYFGGVPKYDIAGVVKIVTGGTPGKATYQYSEDGGKTWQDEEVLPQNGVLDTGNDDITCRFTKGVYMEGDTYKVSIVGVPDKDYSTAILFCAIGVAAAAVFGILFYLNSKRAKADTYEIVK